MFSLDGSKFHIEMNERFELAFQLNRSLRQTGLGLLLTAVVLAFSPISAAATTLSIKAVLMFQFT